MLALVALAFGAGMLTMVGPCTLPILPLVIGAASTGRLRRVAAMLLGFGTTFVLTTAVVVGSVASLGLATQPLRLAAAAVFVGAGALLLLPAVADRLAAGFARATHGAASASALGPYGDAGAGLAAGAGIGLLWAPCVAPLMAGVIASAVVEGPTPSGVAIASAYVAGAVVPLAAVALGGRALALRLGGAAHHLQLRRAYGALMLVAALAIGGGADLRLQAALSSTAGPGSGPIGATPVDGQPPSPSADLDDLGPAPELTGITSWINSPPLTMASLRGKVVLVHFWTFACINCIHVQPYVKAWAERYAADGLVVIGVHTPELSFERELDNVRQAVVDNGVRFPVAFDPAFATWRAYDNRAWPAFYFVDRDGRIRHTHGGEGDYDGSERVLQALLAGE